MRIPEPTEQESVILADAARIFARQAEAAGCALVLIVTPRLLGLELMAPHVEVPVLRLLPMTDTLATDIVEGVRLHNARQP